MIEKARSEHEQGEAWVLQKFVPQRPIESPYGPLLLTLGAYVLDGNFCGYFARVTPKVMHPIAPLSAGVCTARYREGSLDADQVCCSTTSARGFLHHGPASVRGFLARAEQIPPPTSMLLPSAQRAFAAWQLPQDDPWSRFNKWTLLSSLGEQVTAGELPDVRNLVLLQRAELLGRVLAQRACHPTPCGLSICAERLPSHLAMRSVTQRPIRCHW